MSSGNAPPSGSSRQDTNTYRAFTEDERTETVNWLEHLKLPAAPTVAERIETVKYIRFDAMQRLKRHQNHPDVAIGPEGVQRMLEVIEKANEVLAFLQSLPSSKNKLH